MNVSAICTAIDPNHEKLFGKRKFRLSAYFWNETAPEVISYEFPTILLYAVAPPPPSHTALEKCNFHRRRRFHSNVQQINRIKFFFYFNVSVSSHKECVFFFFLWYDAAIVFCLIVNVKWWGLLNLSCGYFLGHTIWKFVWS